MTTTVTARIEQDGEITVYGDGFRPGGGPSHLEHLN
jgi:hypothetical protein